MSGWSLFGCQPAVVDSLWRWRVLAKVSCWLYVNSRSLHLLSFVSPSPMPNLQTVPALCWYSSGCLLVFQLPWTTSILGSLCYDATKLLIELFDLLHYLRLVHRPGWLWCCVVLLRSGWRWVCWRWECSWWYYLQLLSLRWMPPHTGVLSLLYSTSLCPCPFDLSKAKDLPLVAFNLWVSFSMFL